jgi:hypothetical protein
MQMNYSKISAGTLILLLAVSAVFTPLSFTPHVHTPHVLAFGGGGGGPAGEGDTGANGDGGTGSGDGTGDSGSSGSDGDGAGADATGPSADVAGMDPDPAADGQAGAIGTGGSNSNPGIGDVGGIGGPNDPGASTGSSANSPDSDSDTGGGFFGGLCGGCAVGVSIDNGISALGNAVADIAGSTVSAAIDVAAGFIGNVVSLSQTGKTVGENATNHSSFVSEAAHGIAAAFSNDNSAQQGFESTSDPNGQGMFGGQQGMEPGQSGPSEPGAPEGSGPGNSFFPTAALAPDIHISVDESAVFVGEPVTLTWSASNASSCTAKDSWSGGKALNGTEQINNLQGNSVFTLTCVGSGGATRTRSAFVSVLPNPNSSTNGEVSSQTEVTQTSGNSAASKVTFSGPPPSISLEALATNIEYGRNVALTWKVENAVGCVGGDDWPHSQASIFSEKNYIPTQGTRVFTYITHTSTYTLSCYSVDGQQAQKSITITVSPPAPVGP